MAGPTNADLRKCLTVDAPPPPTIPKDMQCSDTSIPLSPQRLLPKLGDNKIGFAAGEPHPHVGNNSIAIKLSGNAEDLYIGEKKKDNVYRPYFYDIENGRSDRWHDEEREGNSIVDRDRWREGEKELSDSRKTERHSHSSSTFSGEVRRLPSERWTDSGYREGKWNTRWGPDDKESQNWREKWSEKDGDSSRDKGAHHLNIHGEDINHQSGDADREREHYSRSWRAFTSTSINRARGETTHYLPSMPTKPASMFGHGRGKADNGASVFPVGRGRARSSMNHMINGPSRHYPLGTAPERSNYIHGDPFVLRYSRMKLLEIYSMSNLKDCRMSFEGSMAVPSLMQAEPLDPLALSAPIPEELVILKAIDKGEILSSGVPQASKDVSIGKSSEDSGSSRLTKPGIRDDLACIINDYRNESAENGENTHFGDVERTLFAKCSGGFDLMKSTNESLHQYQEDNLAVEVSNSGTTSYKANDSSYREVNELENTIPLSFQSVGEQFLQSSSDLGELAEVGSRLSDKGWLHLKKDGEIEQMNGSVACLSYFKDESLGQKSRNLHSKVEADSSVRRQQSDVIEKERTGFVSHSQDDPFDLRDKLSDRKFLPYPSPENLSLYYKDPHGQIQGPFSGSDLIGWFDAGYFGIDLKVRLSSAPADAPFLLLGDVIPQLRTRVRPPPGFGTVRQNEFPEASSGGKFGGSGNIHASVAEYKLMKDGEGFRNESKLEEENRFLESHMSGRISSSVSEIYSLGEDILGYRGLVGGRPSLEAENMSRMNYLAKKMSLEQRSLQTPYWPGKDVPAIVSKTDFVKGSPIPHSQFLPQMGESPHNIPQSPQTMDLLSILQSAAVKTAPAINNSFSVWPNLLEVQALENTHGNIDILKDTMGLHHNQPNINPQINPQIFFGTPQRLQPQFPPSLSNLTQLGDLSSGGVPPEKLVASEFSQDPQMNLLLQQLLLSQQSHSQVPLPTHLYTMDLLLRMQRQKQEQKQKQLLVQQQQQLLSQVLSGHLSHQLHDDTSFGHLNTGLASANASSQTPVLQQMHEVLQSKQQVPVLDSNDTSLASCAYLNLHGAQDDSMITLTEHSHLSLPNQIIGYLPQPDLGDATPLQDVESTQNSDSKQKVLTGGCLLSAGEGPVEKAFLPMKNALDTETSLISQGLSQTTKIETTAADAVSTIVSPENFTGVPDSVPSASAKTDLMVYLETISKQAHTQTATLKGVKNVELPEVKKASEKSRKKKSSKLQAASDHGKGSKATRSHPSRSDLDTEEANANREETERGSEATEPHHGKTIEAGGENSSPLAVESLAHGACVPLWGIDLGKKGKVEEGKQSLASDTIPVIIPTDTSAPSACVATNSGSKYAEDTAQSASVARSISRNPENPWNSTNRRSQLHDVLAEEVLAKASEGAEDILAGHESGQSLPPPGSDRHKNGQSLPPMVAQIGTAVDDDDGFVEAKETRKSRRKAAKNKGAAVKASTLVISTNPLNYASSAEKTKATLQMDQDKELLLVPPVAPSLGDFVFWKGDEASSIPASAWSIDSVKPQKPFLRDILREQEKKTTSSQQQIPIPATKVQPNRSRGGSSSSLQLSGSSPSKALSSINLKCSSPVQTGSPALGQSKKGSEDDFFWGPLDQAKKGGRSGFPSIAISNSSSGKGNSTKGSLGDVSNRKPSSSRPPEHSIISSPAISRSLSKGRKDSASKYLEAMEFRDWCKEEWFRLTGTNDTSFLEFCLKQTISEVEALLRENLGSLDRSHEFIDKFLNYKEFISSDITEIVFQDQNSCKVSDKGHEKASHATEFFKDVDAGANHNGVDGSGKRGKKKDKKGKKLNPTILGFNVVSNRIMMGDIQTIED